MEIELKWNGSLYQVELNNPIDISIPLEHHKGPNAFNAPPFESEPFKSGAFVGSLDHGSPVNFYNLRINPHGNGTHTESVLHIDRRGKSINETLKRYHHISQLMSIRPKELDNGDRVIQMQQVIPILLDSLDALIIRTLPNNDNKTSRQYSGTNPPYVSPELLEQLKKTSIQHLLIDLPSVDKEKDEGALKAHKAFWDVNGGICLNKTITEMIYVDTSVQDGLYLLNLQIASVESDAAPSKPVLFNMKCIERLSSNT